MANLFIRHKIRNYSVWKVKFDEFRERRKAGGEKSYQIFHPYDDPNNLFILFEWHDVNTAKDFINSPDLTRILQYKLKAKSARRAGLKNSSREFFNDCRGKTLYSKARFPAGNTDEILLPKRNLGLKSKMDEAGVIDQPDIVFLTKVDEGHLQ